MAKKVKKSKKIRVKGLRIAKPDKKEIRVEELRVVSKGA
jgi:hypothetical protein